MPSCRSPARALVAALALSFTTQAAAFCGFFVGKADTTLYNKASQVILVREGNRTVISMLNDYRGEPSQFALVVPVPQVLERGQIRVGDRKVFERIDAFTAPRLAEYFDPDPCERNELAMRGALMAQAPRPIVQGRRQGQGRARRDASRHATPSASTTSRSCRPPSPTASRPGCGATATASRRAHRPRCSPTCASTSSSSWRG